MMDYFASGRAVDVVLIVIALEALWLIRRKRSVGEVALVLGPGVCLLLALRAALTGAGWPWIALALTASLPLHLLDLRRQLARPAGP